MARGCTGRLLVMANVLGIGGVFVKSKDADALRTWYREMLGVEIEEWGGAQFWSMPAKTYSVWSAFRADTKYFEPSEREFMINLRVDDLDGLLAKLRAAGALDRREESPTASLATWSTRTARRCGPRRSPSARWTEAARQGRRGGRGPDVWIAASR